MFIVHSNVEILKCDQCEFKSQRPAKLRKHVDLIHNLIEIKCDICDKTFSAHKKGSS